MPMENQLAHAITQTEYDLSYDKAAKKLLANKQILAQIMKNCVNEYSACSVDEIAEKYIEGTPEVGTVGVHVDDTNRPKKTSDVIAGSNNEDSTLTEGTINYDVRFDAIAPASEGSAEQKDVIRLIINVEEEFGVAMNEELEREVLVMCNLSQGVKAEGREEGISIGEMRMLVQLVRDGDLKMERAAEKAKMTVEQFKKVMENTPLQAV